MTENKKIAQIKWLIEKHPVISKDKDFIEPLTDAIQALEENQEFHAIGTIEEFKALKEKSVAKKAIGSKLHNEANCPNCGYTIADDEFYLLSDYTHYCPDCGQAVKDIDWD